MDGCSYRRGDEVVVRTERGLEYGRVAAPPMDDEPVAQSDGQLVRLASIQDRLLHERLERNRHDAFEACRRKLAELNISATLVDVELLFDGQTIYFYFLGGVTDAVADAAAELAAAYDAESQIARFAETLSAGCGPDCGTESAGGCGDCGAGCPVASACSR